MTLADLPGSSVTELRSCFGRASFGARSLGALQARIAEAIPD